MRSASSSAGRPADRSARPSDSAVISACSARAQRVLSACSAHRISAPRSRHRGRARVGLGFVTGRAGDYRHEGRASLDDFAVLEDDHVRCVPDSGTAGGSAAWCTVYAQCMYVVCSACMLYAACMLHVACCTYVACCMLHAARCMSLCALRC